MKRKVIRFLNQKWLQHLIFWMLSVYSIASFFSISNSIKEIDFVYSLCFHFCLIPIVYINLKKLVPQFLKSGRYILYPILLALNILIGLGLHELIFEWVIPRFFEGYYIVSFTDPLILIIIFLTYLTLTTLIKLSRSWFELQETQREKTRLELTALRTQINPHFLFNGLNSIYSLSLKKDPGASEAILKLSGMLRYVLYEVGNTFVDLAKEIEMMQQYLDIQRLRVREEVNISLEVEGLANTKKIAPMVFFPILENAFKHGDLQKEGYIDAHLNIHENDVDFYCENRKAKIDEPATDHYGGIGLENIRKRLELLYPSAHTFRISEDDTAFIVEINLTLK